MDGKDLAQLIEIAVADGRITTFKREEEERRVSRSTIRREIDDGKFKAIRIKNQWLLVKQ